MTLFYFLIFHAIAIYLARRCYARDECGFYAACLLDVLHEYKLLANT